jgi:hypothetical protein
MILYPAIVGRAGCGKDAVGFFRLILVAGNEVWSAGHRREAYDTLPRRRWASGVRERRGRNFQSYKRSGTRRLNFSLFAIVPQIVLELVLVLGISQTAASKITYRSTEYRHWPLPVPSCGDQPF